MDRVTSIIWNAAQKPPGEAISGGICRVCGDYGNGIPFSDWVRPTFTDWDKILPGDIFCQACQFCFEEQSELLAQLVGKEKPQRMRNYSHFVVDGEWIPLSKGDKAKMQGIYCIIIQKSPLLQNQGRSTSSFVLFLVSCNLRSNRYRIGKCYQVYFH